MPPFNVIINFSSCLQFKTNLPCHGPDRKRGRKPIGAQAAHVSLVTAGSRYSHGSARLNDCALVAFSNPFEINLILIYLQSPSLQSKGSVSSHAGGWITHKQTAGSASQPARYPHHGHERWQEEPHSLSLGQPPSPRVPWWTLPSHIFFFPCAARVDYWPHQKNPSFLDHRGNHVQEPGVAFGSDLVTSKLARFVGKFRELRHHDLNEATIRVAFFQRCV